MSDLYKFPFKTQQKFIKDFPIDSFLGNKYPKQYHEYIADKMIEKLPELNGLDEEEKGYLIETIKQSQEPLPGLIDLPEVLSKRISGFSHFTEGWTIIKDAAINLTNLFVDKMIGDGIEDIPDFFDMAVENHYGCFMLSNNNAYFDDHKPSDCVKNLINTNDFSYKSKNPAVSKEHPSLYIAPGALIKLLIEKEKEHVVIYDKVDELKVDRQRGNKMKKKKQKKQKKEKKSKKRINSRKKKKKKKKSKKKKK